MPLDPRQAWAAFRRRPDEATFAPIYERTKGLVYTICRRVLHDEEDALDAFQAAYGRLYAAARGGVPEADAESVDRLAARLAAREADNLRKRRGRLRRREVAMEALPPAIDERPSPADEAAAVERRAALERVVAQLPERYRLPVQLYYFHGMTHQQIADALDRPVKTISSQIARALKRLDPLAQRAGLVDSTAALGAMLPVKAMLQPPAAMSAEKVLGVVLAAPNLLANVEAAGAAAAGGALAGSALKTKWAALGALTLLAVGAPVAYRAAVSRGEEAQTPPVETTAPEADDDPTLGRTFSMNRGDQAEYSGIRIRLVRVEANDPDDPNDDSAEFSLVTGTQSSQLTIRVGDTIHFEGFAIFLESATATLDAGARRGGGGALGRRGEGSAVVRLTQLPPPPSKPIA